MYLFVDSEFLPRADGSNELLSIGLCGMDGREFYAEHDVQVDPAGDEFVSAEVLPQLGRGGGIRGALPDVGAALANWLCQYGAEQLEVCYDYHVDREALETLLLVANPSRPICFEPVHVAYLLADEEGRLAAERCWTEIDVSRGAAPPPCARRFSCATRSLLRSSQVRGHCSGPHASRPTAGWDRGHEPMSRYEPSEARLGVDIGRVLIAPSSDDSSDTSFFGGTNAVAMTTPPYTGMFEHLPVIVQRFHCQVWLVSKAGPAIQAKTLRWLEHHRFHERTGIPHANVRFCRERWQKAEHCEALGITHFIDDRQDVLQHLDGLVPQRFLFGPQDGPAVDRRLITLSTWAEAGMKVFPGR
jgi:hypothetical protein